MVVYTQWQKICPLCLRNHIGDEQYYILHCTNSNFIEPRKSFLMELYRINTNNFCLSPKDITNKRILPGKLMREISETYEFLYLISELGEKLLREADT